MDVDEFKTLLEEQGKAFEAFKKGVDAELAELKKRGAADVVATEKIARIGADLDKLVEAKAAFEAKLAAEAKEREALELRMARRGNPGKTDETAADRDRFNIVLKAAAAERSRSVAPLDDDGYRAYKAAQRSWLVGGAHALTHDEVKTLSVGSDPDGGYFVTPDVTGRIVTKVYETSPMRQVASVMTISTDALEGIEDLGEAGAGYAGETATGSDTTTPQVGKWRIPVYWIDTEPKATQQLLDDAGIDIEAWLAGKVADKFARFENAEFVAGATGKIRGLTSYATAADSGSGVTWGSLGHVATGTSGAFPTANPADKLHDLVGTLKEAYLGNARWMAKRATITQIRKFKDGTGNYLWSPGLLGGQPETIMGFPVARAEDMPTIAANSLSLAFGDFAACYQIVDRQGMRVLRDALTSKPYVKFYTTKRTGGGVVNFEAVKFLKFGTS